MRIRVRRTIRSGKALFHREANAYGSRGRFHGRTEPGTSTQYVLLPTRCIA